ncbi:hypothetical protein AAF712_004568 [Marasmius tenuissimus]|uniref:Uncharacterized protein n=1 Tax=Marasmius tenuissimus TaxID=585030 RepID=A0ABR3A3D8_9AGAR
MLPTMFFLASLAISSFANTEIVNFDASSKGIEVALEIDWPALHPRDHERILQVNSTADKQTRVSEGGPCTVLEGLGPCQNEVWLKLALDEGEWQSFSKFTLRVSWPANYPTDFSIDVFSPEAVASYFHLQPSESNSTMNVPTRVKYARITALHTGVIVPAMSHIQPKLVPFVVTLEGLYFGVLPESVVPIVLCLAVVLLGLYFIVPKVVRGVERVAQDARLELTEMKGKRE